MRGEPQETRRIVLARLPGPLEGPAATVDAVIAALPASTAPRAPCGAGPEVGRDEFSPRPPSHLP
jgi:hypothetical protein